MYIHIYKILFNPINPELGIIPIRTNKISNIYICVCVRARAHMHVFIQPLRYKQKLVNFFKLSTPNIIRSFPSPRSVAPLTLKGSLYPAI